MVKRKDVRKEVEHLKEILNLKIEKLHELFDVKLELADKALKLNAGETSRRLEVDNSEFKKELVDVNNKINDMQLYKANLTGKQTVITAAIAMIVSLAVALIVNSLK